MEQQPKTITKYESYKTIITVPMIQNEDGSWTEDRENADETNTFIREWFENENGEEMVMEEEI